MTIQSSRRPPFRADHVGSLLRPASVRQAFRDAAAGKITAHEVNAIQDEAIRAVVKMQREAGLAVVSDGEFRRGSYWGRFVERLKGFVIKPASFSFRDDSGHTLPFTAPYAQGRIIRDEPLAVDEYEFLHKVAGEAGVTGKITIPAPSTLHYYRFNDFGDRSVYPDEDQLFADVAKVFVEEVRALTDAGCRYIQFDEVAVAMLGDPLVREQTVKLGQDPGKLLMRYIDLINQAVAAAPADCLFGVHMCRGNLKGHYLANGGYDLVAEQFFAQTNVTHFLLEYDTQRAGDFTPLRYVPADKGVVLGVISSKSPVLESVSALEARVAEAARHMDISRLGISPQCGFASTVGGNPVTEADQFAKLQLVCETARKIWNSN